MANMNGNLSSKGESFDDLPSIVGFDEILKNSLKSFIDLSAKIGNDVKTIVYTINFYLYHEFMCILCCLIYILTNVDYDNNSFCLISLRSNILFIFKTVQNIH
jgi:hypothetical protein